MTANINAMLRAAADAANANKKADARALLERVLEIDQYNEQAWVELSKIVDDVEERRTCLENILVINPSSVYAKEMLNRLNAGTFSPPAAAPSTPAFSVPEDDLFSGIGFDTAAEPAGWSDEPDPWATATSSPSAIVDDYAPTIPEDWAANIVKKPASPAISEAFETGAFSEFDEDLFGAVPTATYTPTDPFESADPFDVGDYAAPSPAFQANVFDASVGAASGSADPFTTAFTSSDFMDDFDAAPFSGPALEDEFDDAPPARNAAVAAGPAPVFKEYEAQIATPPADETFSDLFTDSAPVRTVGAPRPLDERSAEELFALIPASIPAGRIPGTDGSLPSSVKLLLGLAILMNIGAFAFLIARLMGLSPI